jgi:hypothetical protein
MESNWVHSALGPQLDLLCQPPVIKIMEKLVEWGLVGQTEVLEENLLQWRSAHHKPHMPARMRNLVSVVESQRLTACATARPFEKESNLMGL